MAKQHSFTLNEKQNEKAIANLKELLTHFGEHEMSALLSISLGTCGQEGCTRTHFNIGWVLPDDLPDQIFYTLLRGLLQRGLEAVEDLERQNINAEMARQIMDQVAAGIARDEGSLQ